MKAGIETGQRMNTWLRDMLTGRFLFRHNSYSDDAAREMEKARAQDQTGRDGEAQAQARNMDRLNRVLDRLERRSPPNGETGRT